MNFVTIHAKSNQAPWSNIVPLTGVLKFGFGRQRCVAGKLKMDPASRYKFRWTQPSMILVVGYTGVMFQIP